ncbi:MAG: kynureninase, partial [Myxococcota bacterium]
ASRGIPALVDTYHSFNALPLQVDDWPGTVFVTGGGYKYAQAGEGACWMLLPANAEAYRPRHTGWFADFGGLDNDAPKINYGDNGHRFLGATFDPTALYRAVWTMRWMDEEGLTPDVLREQSLRATALTIAMYDRYDLAKKGLKLLTPRDPTLRGAFVTFETPQAARLCEVLALRGVRTDRRGTMLRFGPAPYTTSVEIRRSIGVLHDLVAS